MVGGNVSTLFIGRDITLSGLFLIFGNLGTGTIKGTVFGTFSVLGTIGTLNHFGPAADAGKTPAAQGVGQNLAVGPAAVSTSATLAVSGATSGSSSAQATKTVPLSGSNFKGTPMVAKSSASGNLNLKGTVAVANALAERAVGSRSRVLPAYSVVNHMSNTSATVARANLDASKGILMRNGTGSLSKSNVTNHASAHAPGPSGGSSTIMISRRNIHR